MDISDIIKADKPGTQIFMDPSTWSMWVKPKHITQVFMLIVGGGAGGGGGATGAAGSNRYGGGGGAAGNSVTLFVPAFLLPDILYIKPGKGGTGGAAGTTGTSGELTYVSFKPNDTSTYLAVSGGGSPVAGGGGTTSAGSAGTIGAIGVPGPLGPLCAFNAIQGTAGQAGGTATPSNGNIVTATKFLGGRGGAGVNSTNTASSGGLISACSPFFAVVAGGVNTGGNGNSRVDWSRMIFPGGTGGGGNASGTGGIGGNGAPGAGGGGGGGGITGGRGGDGGNGFVYIVCY